MLNRKAKKANKSYKMHEAKKAMRQLSLERELLLNTVIY